MSVSKFVLLVAVCMVAVACAGVPPEQQAAVGVGVVGAGIASWQQIVEILQTHDLIKPEQAAALQVGVNNANNMLDAVTQVMNTVANSIASVKDQIAHTTQIAMDAKASAGSAVTPTEVATGIGVVAAAAEAARRAHGAGKKAQKA